MDRIGEFRRKRVRRRLRSFDYGRCKTKSVLESLDREFGVKK